MESKLLTVNETAARLALQPCTIRKMVLERKIDYVKVGARAIRIPAQVVEERLRTGYRRAIPVAVGQ